MMLRQELATSYAPSTQGRAGGQIQTPSFRITEAAYDPGTRFSAHAHEHASITAVFDGGFVECFRKTSESCAAGSILIKPAAEIHSNAYGNQATRCLLVAVTQPIGRLGRVFDRTIHLRGGASYSLLVALRQEVQLADDLTPLAAEGLLLELLARVARNTRATDGAAPRWLKMLRGTLRERCREPLAMSDVGAIAGVHPAYATRLFRKYYGCTPTEFVRRCRIDWAASALVETNASISSISAGAGFSDQSHFTRTFTRLMGRTPNSVRRELLDLRTPRRRFVSL
jgi:AraC family transcriptional regulator